MISVRERFFVVFAAVSLILLILFVACSNNHQEDSELNTKAKSFVDRIHTNRAYLLVINQLNQPINVSVGIYEGLEVEPFSTSRLISQRVGSLHFSAKPQKGELISQDFHLSPGAIHVLAIQKSNGQVTIKGMSSSYVGIKEDLAQLCVLNFDPQSKLSYLIELHNANDNKTILNKIDALYNKVHFIDAKPGKYDVRAIKQSEFGKDETLLPIEFRPGTRYVFMVNSPLEPGATKYVLARMGPGFEVSQQGMSGN